MKKWQIFLILFSVSSVGFAQTTPIVNETEVKDTTASPKTTTTTTVDEESSSSETFVAIPAAQPGTTAANNSNLPGKEDHSKVIHVNIANQTKSKLQFIAGNKSNNVRFVNKPYDPLQTLDPPQLSPQLV